MYEVFLQLGNATYALEDRCEGQNQVEARQERRGQTSFDT